MSYISFAAIIIVVILLIWTLVLNYQDRKRGRLPRRKRLSDLRKRIDALPEKTEEDRTKKDSMYRELSLELLEGIYTELDDIKSTINKKSNTDKKPTKAKKKAKKSKKK